LLKSAVARKKPGKVWISGVCDPYQPLEAKYKLTRRCLEILAENGWPVVIQTRSPLILRDMDILKKAKNFEAGLTVTTADDNVRKMFEPKAPAIEERLAALAELHRAGIKTYAMIAPMLPGSADLAELLAGKIDYAIVDRLNYHYADRFYRKYGLEDKMTDDFFNQTKEKLFSAFDKLAINY